MHDIPVWSSDDAAAWQRAHCPPSRYFAMYSSEWGAIVTDTPSMRVPVDDHLVHRGDGVFETLLCAEWGVYNLSAHLERLQRSAAALHIPLPWTGEELRAIVCACFRVAGQSYAAARVLVGRGTGGFGVDPRECRAPSLYVIVYAAPRPFMERVPEGARVEISRVPVKPMQLASIKTCNYLPNVLMKWEANKAGAHFVVGVDPDGFLTESFTENLMMVDEQGVLRYPPVRYHLPGTTQARVLALAAPLLERGELAGVEERAFTLAEARRAREILMVGTTAFVTAVTRFAGDPVGQGTPGPVALWLDLALRQDVHRNPAVRCPVLL